METQSSVKGLIFSHTRLHHQYNCKSDLSLSSEQGNCRGKYLQLISVYKILQLGLPHSKYWASYNGGLLLVLTGKRKTLTKARSQSSSFYYEDDSDFPGKQLLLVKGSGKRHWDIWLLSDVCVSVPKHIRHM